MDLEALTKHQIVLLTLLISFVTSIATGIVTVSLMDQGSMGVSQTVNRVVERTIERVVQSVSTSTTTPPVIVTPPKPTTLPDTAFSNAIEKNVTSFVGLYTASETGDVGAFVGTAVITSAGGQMIIGTLLSDGKYVAMLSDGSRTGAEMVHAFPDNDLSVLKPVSPPQGITFVPAQFGNSDTLRVGQQVVGLSNAIYPGAGFGIVSFLNREDVPAKQTVDGSNGTSTTTPGSTTGGTTGGANTGTGGQTIPAAKNKLTYFTTSPLFSDKKQESIVFLASGEFMGIAVRGDPVTEGRYIPSNLLRQLLSQLP